MVSYATHSTKASLGMSRLKLFFCVVCFKPDSPVMVIRIIISPPLKTDPNYIGIYYKIMLVSQKKKVISTLFLVLDNHIWN